MPNNQDSLFQQAIIENKLAEVKQMIEKGYKPTDEITMLALGNAVLNESMDLINYLLDTLVRPVKDKGYFSAVLAACRKGNCEIIQKLLTHQNKAALESAQFDTILLHVLNINKFGVAVFLLEQHLKHFMRLEVIQKALQTLSAQQPHLNSSNDKEVEKIRAILKDAFTRLETSLSDSAPTQVEGVTFTVTPTNVSYPTEDFFTAGSLFEAETDINLTEMTAQLRLVEERIQHNQAKVRAKEAEIAEVYASMGIEDVDFNEQLRLLQMFEDKPLAHEAWDIDLF